MIHVLCCKGKESSVVQEIGRYRYFFLTEDFSDGAWVLGT